MTSHLRQNGFPSTQRKRKRRHYHCCCRHRCGCSRISSINLLVWQSESFTLAIVLQKRRSRLWVIGSYEMPRCDWLQHCNFLAGIEILPFALQTACKPCGFAAGRPAIVAGPVLRVAIGESCSVCRALKASASRAADLGFDSRFLRGHLSRWSHTSDLQTGTPVDASPGA